LRILDCKEIEKYDEYTQYQNSNRFIMCFFSFLAPTEIILWVPQIYATPRNLSHTRNCEPTTNTPEDRQSWGDFDISTNYYNVTPDTGCTVEVITMSRLASRSDVGDSYGLISSNYEGLQMEL
jgi:hypothetical protein